MVPKVYVIVLNWNGWSDTAACLSSLQQLSYENFRVVVVDNDSTDDSCARLRAAFPWANVVEAGKNLGFAGGCNFGMRPALVDGAEFVWLLNNDTTVAPDALTALVDKALSAPDIGAVGSAIYCAHDPEQLESWGGGRINFILGRSRPLLMPVADERVEFITGASLLLSRKVIETVGQLDEGFFMYWEDADYCLRLRDAGWRLAVAGQSKVWHKGSASIGKRSVRMDTCFNASAVRFFDRHARVPIVPLGVGIGLRLVKRIVARDWERVRAVWAGANVL